METHHAAEMAAKDARIAALEKELKAKEDEIAEMIEASEAELKATKEMHRYGAELFAASMYDQIQMLPVSKEAFEAALQEKEEEKEDALQEKEEELTERYQKEKEAALKAKEDELTKMKEDAASMTHQINVMLAM
jgi:hypothetical protein